MGAALIESSCSYHLFRFLCCSNLLSLTQGEERSIGDLDDERFGLFLICFVQSMEDLDEERFLRNVP